MVLHICGDYWGTPVYHELLAHLSPEMQRRSLVYAPLSRNHAFLGKHSFDRGAVPVISSEDYRQFDRLFYHHKCAKIRRSLERQVPLDRVSLIHAHYLFAGGGVAHDLKRSMGIPYVVAVRNSDVNVYFRFGWHLRRTGVGILEQASRIVFLAPAYRDTVLDRYVPGYLRSAIEAKTAILPNGIHQFWFENRLTGRPAPPPGSLNLIYVGEISRNKNIEASIAATALLRRRGYDARFTIIGTGRHATRIRALAEQHAPYVRVFDWITSKQELLSHYRAADVFTMPSFTETFGLVYFEAMSQSLPIIYTRGEGIDGTFKDGVVGFACNPSSVAQITDSIEKIIGNYHVMSKACAGAIDRCNWHQIAKEYEGFYRQI